MILTHFGLLWPICATLAFVGPGNASDSQNPASSVGATTTSVFRSKVTCSAPLASYTQQIQRRIRSYSEPNKTDDILEECDFDSSPLDSLRQRPLRIATSKDLGLLQTTARHLSEIHRLSYHHREKLVEQISYAKLNDTSMRLEIAVGTPLRFMCSGLKRLDASLPTTGLDDIFRNEGRREIVRSALEKFNYEISLQLGKRFWECAPQTAELSAIPEIRSENCLKRNCFVINDQALDHVSSLMLFHLYDTTRTAIRRVMGDTDVPTTDMRDIAEDIEIGLKKLWVGPKVIWNELVRLYDKYSLPLTAEWWTLAFIIGGLNIFIQMIVSERIPQELYRLGVR